MRHWIIPFLLLVTPVMAQEEKKPLGPPKPEKTEEEKQREEAERLIREAEEARKREAARRLSHTAIKRHCNQIVIPGVPGLPFDASPGRADAARPNIADIKLPEGMPQIIVPPRRRTTNRVIFLVDVSGSMKHEGKLRRAIQSAMLLLTYGGMDDFQVKIHGFASTSFVWPGHTPTPEELAEELGGATEIRRGNPPPPGWTLFPSKRGLDKAVKWLVDLGAKGGTSPAPALAEALRTPRKDLTVIVISDGEFTDSHVEAAIREGQAWRQENVGEPAIIGAFGVGTFFSGKDGDGDADSDLVSLRKIGEIGQGGTFVDVPPESPDIEEAPDGGN